MRKLLHFRNLTVIVLFFFIGSNFYFANAHTNIDKHNNKQVEKTTDVARILNCELGTDFKFEINDNIIKVIATTKVNTRAQFIWSFGDGSTGSGNESKHEYKLSGEYRVCVTAIVPGNSNTDSICEETVCKAVLVGRNSDPCNLNPDFKFDIRGNILLLHGTSTAGNNAIYQWKISDGSSYSGVDIKHEIKRKGDYEVCLIVTTNRSNSNNLSCTATICKRVSIIGTNVPDCQIKADFKFDVNGNILLANGFSEAGNNAIYQWKISDGSSYRGIDIKHEFKRGGNYEVCLIVTPIRINTATLSQACETIICKRITIPTNNDCGLEADFKFDILGRLLKANGKSNAGNNAIYQWKISDGTSYRGADIKHEFKRDGTYEVCLTVTSIRNATVNANQNCTVTICKKISVSNQSNDSDCNLVADFQFIYTNIGINLQARSNDANAEYLWTIAGKDETFTGQNVSIPFIDKTTRINTICLTIMSKLYGCEIEICKRVGNPERPNTLTLSTLYAPNPVVDYLQVNSDKPLITCEVYNMSHVLVQSAAAINASSTTIDFSNMKSGVYIVLLRFEDGTTEIQKIIKN